MDNILLKIALILSATAIIVTAIVMYPTYRCMMIAADGSGSEIICIIKQN